MIMEMRRASFLENKNFTMPTLMAANHASMRIFDSRTKIEIMHQVRGLEASANLQVLGTYRCPGLPGLG
jgi:hypothetical protein